MHKEVFVIDIYCLEFCIQESIQLAYEVKKLVIAQGFQYGVILAKFVLDELLFEYIEALLFHFVKHSIMEALLHLFHANSEALELCVTEVFLMCFLEGVSFDSFLIL